VKLNLKNLLTEIYIIWKRWKIPFASSLPFIIASEWGGREINARGEMKFWKVVEDEQNSWSSGTSETGNKESLSDYFSTFGDLGERRLIGSVIKFNGFSACIVSQIFREFPGT